MTFRRALIAFGLLTLAASAQAQDVTNPSPPNSVNGAYNASSPTCVDGHGCWLQLDINGNLKVVSSGTPSGIQSVKIDQTTPGTTNNITVSPLPRAARNFPGCSVTTSSAQCLATNTAVSFLQVQNTGTANAIACAFGATASLNSIGSFQLAAGQGASWGPNTGGVPTGALNCIAATGTTPLFVEWL